MTYGKQFSRYYYFVFRIFALGMKYFQQRETKIFTFTSLKFNMDYLI